MAAALPYLVLASYFIALYHLVLCYLYCLLFCSYTTKNFLPSISCIVPARILPTTVLYFLLYRTICGCIRFCFVLVLRSVPTRNACAGSCHTIPYNTCMLPYYRQYSYFFASASFTYALCHLPYIYSLLPAFPHRLTHSTTIYGSVHCYYFAATTTTGTAGATIIPYIWFCLYHTFIYTALPAWPASVAFPNACRHNISVYCFLSFLMSLLPYQPCYFVGLVIRALIPVMVLPCYFNLCCLDFARFAGAFLNNTPATACNRVTCG